VALLTALEQDTHSNVLSAPTLLTADNEEAMIVVGENLPFVSGSSANSALSGAIFNSVDRQNVGITLDIIPQVSEGDYVKLDLYEEVSNVVPGTTNVVTNPNGPTTTIRSASTTVLVMDHRTAVIGGLLANDTENAVQGVPFISDIPVIGNLFSDRSRTTAKTNLLVFLTPHIIRTRQDLRALSLAERQDLIKRLGPKEMHNMPEVQIRELSKPSFSISVPPAATLPPPYNSDGTNSVTIPGGAATRTTPGTGASAGYGSSTSYSTSTTYSTGVTGGALGRTMSGYVTSYSGPGSYTTTSGPGAYGSGGSGHAAPLDSGAGAVGGAGAAP
jgi:general secretion pathway protein D